MGEGEAQKGQGEAMTDATSALRAAAFHLFAPINLTEIYEGIKYVEAAIAALPPGTNADLVKMIETLDWRLLEQIADGLESESAKFADFPESKMDNLPPEPRPKRRRKPRLDRMIAQAEKASGKSITSITTPDGITLTFGEPAPAASDNPWLADLEKNRTKQ
jgi:hypothetical protein